MVERGDEMNPEPEEQEEVAYQPVPIPEPEAEVEEDELAELFEVPQPEDNDIRTDDLFQIDNPDEDLSDLTEVRHEDIMGEAYPGLPPAIGEESTQRVPRRIRRTPRRYFPPETGMTGIR